MQKVLTLIVFTLLNLYLFAGIDTDLVRKIESGEIKVYDTADVLSFDTVPQMHDDPVFVAAYNELSDMLAGRRNYDLKRAVFIVESAYDRGLDYTEYCKSISDAVVRINKYIDEMKIRLYKTCVNAALFDFFSKPSWVNGNRAITYDVSDPGGTKDITNLFVTKLMRTHSGQCQSMPFYYKILCNELGGKVSMAFCPNHLYLKHVGEDGQWYNVELTTASFARDEWYIQSMDIPTEAIRNGVFLSALSQQEEIAYMLVMLAEVYRFKYHDYDAFTLACADRILETLPTYSHALYLKQQVLQQYGYDYTYRIGQKRSGFIENVTRERHRILHTLYELGFRTITIQKYIENVDKAYRQLGEDSGDGWKSFKDANDDKH